MPLNIDFQQVLLHLLNVVILFGALYFLLYGPVKKFMESREKTYKDMDEQAKAKLQDAENTKAEYEQKLADCETEIEKSKQAAEAETANKAQEILENAKSDASKILAKAKAEAEKEKTALLESAKKEIAAAAVEMAEKIVSESVSESYDAFIDSATMGENK